jgi:hypothetical protein
LKSLACYSCKIMTSLSVYFYIPEEVLPPSG